MSHVRDLLIIGGGPAGYTAAIYAARAGLKPVVLEGDQPGGQLMITTEVENYPGFPGGGIAGPELMQRFRQQALDFGAELIQQRALAANFTGYQNKWVWFGRPDEYGGARYEARAVIIATGAKAKLTGLPGEERFWGRGVSACATCDGFFFRGKQVAVIGGGDTACEEALFLANMCEKVWLIHRRPEFRASKIMQDRVRNHPKIECVMDVTMGGFGTYEGWDRLSLIHFTPNSDPLDRQFLEVEGAFIAIGHEPATGFLDPQEVAMENGYILTDPGRTGVLHAGDVDYDQVIPGVFAAGDCADHVFRQAITAAGEGCKAAMEAERYLSSL